MAPIEADGADQARRAHVYRNHRKETLKNPDIYHKLSSSPIIGEQPAEQRAFFAVASLPAA